MRLIRGDLHAHTIGSDGNLTIDELTDMAVHNGLDFLFITDHNNYAHNEYLRPRPDLTLLPGVEWTHFKGHIGMLGVRRAYPGAYYENDIEGVRRKIRQARDSGAIVVINHPFDAGVSFEFGLDQVEFDAVVTLANELKAQLNKAIALVNETKGQLNAAIAVGNETKAQLNDALAKLRLANVIA
jgi:predicted metal-dependent phosphoesterase TrpH